MGVADIIVPSIRQVTLYVYTKDILYCIPVSGKRGTCKINAATHIGLSPKLIDLLLRDSLMAIYGLDKPYVFLKEVVCFHWLVRIGLSA